MKPTICKHCQAVGKHYSFKCPTIRKPIKSKAVELSDDQMIASKRVVKHNPKTPKSLIKKVSKAISKPNRDTLPELLRLAEIVFNKWVKKRDSLKDGTFQCISCGKFFSAKVGEAGHYRPKTVASLRFNEFNINLECNFDNCHNPDHLIGYRENLIKKIGLKKVEQLDAVAFGENFKWSREELIDLISKYK